MLKRLLYSILLVFVVTVVNAQTDELNVLKDRLSEAQSVEDKVNILAELYKKSEGTVEPEQQVKFLVSALQIAKESDNEEIYAYVLQLLVSHHVNLGNPEEAKVYFDQLMEVCNNAKQSYISCSQGMLSYATSLRREANYKDASQYAFRALENAEQLKDTTLLISAHNQVAILHYLTADSVEGIKHMQKCLDLVMAKGGNEGKTAQLMVNLAIMYKNKRAFKKAGDLFEKAIVIWKSMGNKRGLAITYTNLAGLYDFQQDRERADQVYKKAFDLLDEINAKPQLCEAYMSYSQSLNRRGDSEGSAEYAYKALEIAKEIGYDKIKVVAYGYLAEAFAEKGDYQKAFEYNKRFHSLNDSISAIEHENTIKELELEHQNKEQESQIEVLNREKELQSLRIKKQDNLLWASGATGLAGIVILILVVTGYRNKRKANALLSRKNEEVEQKNKEITDSIHYARNIQDAFLPHADLEKLLSLEAMVCYLPRDIVSGDFYWVHHTTELLMWAVVDCTGHGVPGALMSILGNTGLNAAVQQEMLKEPAEIMTYLSGYVREALSRQGDVAYAKDGMDMSLCVLNKQTGKLKFCGANNVGVIVRDAEITRLKAVKRPVGYYVEDIPFTSEEITLNKGDVIYLYSDGYPDQFGGEKGKKLKAGKFMEILREVHKLPMAEQQQILNDRFNAWKGSNEQLDDVCVMGVRY